MILVLFMLLVTFTLLIHLSALLRPYQVQKSHESWAENVAKQLQIEEAYRWELVGQGKLDTDEGEAAASRIQSTRELLSSMKQEMSENRAAPKLLGVLELNEALIDALIGTITTSGLTLCCCFFNGLMTDIGERSGFYPTAEPTFAPTW